MADPYNLIVHFQKILQNKADPKVKDWWENYVKGAKFRGVKMAENRKSVNSWIKEFSIDENDPMVQFDLGLGLIRQKYTEDKLGGILLIQEHINRKNLVPWQIQLEPYSSLFLQNHLGDWNIVDWFCVKVMGNLAKDNGENIFTQIDPWKDSKNVWQRRSSVVSFVNLAKLGDSFYSGFYSDLLNRCDYLLTSKERFIQTGVGWVLRELSKSDPESVFTYLLNNRAKFTGEGLRYASEKLNQAQKLTLKE